ncbi:hypothetical protein FSP39_014562 [Pinctada imbricata]|uniref:Protein SPEC3 n=1 Tax=Pinctada imbricata TaxID=66713 RepID=A0AA89C1T8_PINIB|nr:hypothetical protein FSP39_014562 [Pinctada imbricata]
MGLGEARARGKNARIAVPAMPCPVASTCCVLNFLVPGLGTILAGFTVFCCSRNEDLTGCEKVGSFCASFWIGFLQLILTPLLLVGWIWSCVWGVSFIGMSTEYYHDNPVDNDGSASTYPVTQQPTATFDPYQQYGGFAQPDHMLPQPAYPRPSPSAPPPDPGNFPQAANPGNFPPAGPGNFPPPGPMPSYGEPPPPYSPPGTYPASALPPKGAS